MERRKRSASQSGERRSEAHLPPSGRLEAVHAIVPRQPGHGGVVKTNIPRSTWWDRTFSYVAFPIERLIADLTAGKFSAWARNERWLARLTAEGGRRIPDKSDPTYQAFLKREIEYWQKPVHGDTETVYAEEHPDRHPKLRAYWHELVSGEPALSLGDMLRKMGPFGKALTLGHFDGLEAILANSVADQWTFNSITGRFAESTPANVSIVCEDLNFASFKENEYDLIVCVGILHHIVNVDQLLAQINRALTANGRFVIFDYIGETRFQWREEKRKYVNNILASIPPKYLRFPFAGIDAIRFGRLSPFEAVTSTCIPGALDKHLRLLESRQAYGVIFPTLQYLRARYLSEDNPIIDMLIQADREASAHGVQPSAMVGVYQKRL